MKLSELSNRKSVFLKEDQDTFDLMDIAATGAASGAAAGAAAAEGVIRQVGNSYYFIQGRDVFRFAVGDNGITTERGALRAARDFQDQWRTRGNRASLRTSGSAVNRNLLRSKIRFSNLGQITRQTAPRVAAFMASRTGVVFMRVLRAFAVEEQLRDGILTTMANIEAEMLNGEITEAEYQDKIQVAWGMYSIQLSVILLAVLRSPRYLNVLRGIRNLVRAGQLAVGATGIGAVPAIISAIVSEAGFQLLIYAITRPTVQQGVVNWIVEWGQESFIGSLLQGAVEGIGSGMQAAASALDSITGGLIGSENFFAASGAAEASGFADPGARDRPGVNGSAFATSQWARLVFQDLIFPPGTSIESRRVPYYTRARREMMMAEDFGEMTRAQPQEADPQETTPQVGGRGDGNAEVERRRRDSEGNTAPLGVDPPSVSPPGTGISSGPVQPVGRVSSSRPEGVRGNIRPGDETNALDAISADRSRFN